MTNYLILLNENNRLPEGFDETITLVSAENAAGEKYQIEKKAYEAFLRLREDVLENDGLQIELISVYRTVAQQQQAWDNYLEEYGLEYTQKYVAVPGHSEHHTGFALDVCVLVDGKVTHGAANLFTMEHLLKVVHAKLPEYGFILRYPAGKEAITKIGYEPWHFRYIDSPEIAQEITNRGICFEEYMEERQ